MAGVVAAAVAAVAIGAALVLVPVPHSFAFTIPQVTSCAGTMTVSFPAHSTVRGTWSNDGNASVQVYVAAESGADAYRANGTSGAFEFTSEAPPYTFDVIPTGTPAGCSPVSPTSFNGTWSIPLL